MHVIYSSEYRLELRFRHFAMKFNICRLTSLKPGDLPQVEYVPFVDGNISLFSNTGIVCSTSISIVVYAYGVCNTVGDTKYIC